MRLFFFLIALLLPTLAAAQDRTHYVGLVAGTAHVGNDTLNDINPGLSFGVRWGTPTLEYHVEGGVFYNSYEEVAPFVIAGISTHLFHLGAVEIRGGVSTGLGYYKELSPILEEEYGIPNFAGYIPLAMATITMRYEELDVRITTIPPNPDTKAVLNLSFAYSF